MTRIYFVRHGENEDQAGGVFASTRPNDNLTERGQLQARQVGASFAGQPIEALVSSPLPRAVQTALVIGEAVGLPVRVIDGLREVDSGHLADGRADERAWDEWERVTGAWAEGRVTVQFPGGDTYLALIERVRGAVEALVDGAEGGPVIAVTHGGLLRVTLHDLCPGSNVTWLRNFPVPHGSITPVDFTVKERRFGGREVRGKVIEWAGVGHLSGAAVG